MFEPQPGIKPGEYLRLPADRYSFICKGVEITLALVGDQGKDRWDVTEGYGGEMSGEQIIHIMDVSFEEAEKVMVLKVLEKFNDPNCQFDGYKLGVYGNNAEKVREYAIKEGYLPPPAAAPPPETEPVFIGQDWECFKSGMEYTEAIKLEKQLREAGRTVRKEPRGDAWDVYIRTWDKAAPPPAHETLDEYIGIQKEETAVPQPPAEEPQKTLEQYLNGG